MEIAFLDLNHITRGVHTNTTPLGVGLIATYLKKNIAHSFGIRMFKITEEALKALKDWKPDVVGIAQYSWNSELNLHVANLIKQSNSSCIVIAGGPNIDASQNGRKAYLNKNKCIDICITFDGEIPFAELIKRLILGETLGDIQRKPGAGTFALDPDSGELVSSSEPPPRLPSLNVFGSVYADGVFDDFLEYGFHPFLQTHRGCPFTCGFCHTSNKYSSKMLFQSPQLFKQDMEYLGEKFAGKHHVTLYLANTNMSFFKEDFPIAEIIRETQEKYDWPKNIDCDSGKNPDKLIKMLSIISFMPRLALQTLTPQVLKNIKRRNISFDKFMAFQKDVLLKTGETSATELILCLPGESKETFKETLSTILNSSIQNIIVYTYMNLKGTPMSTEENIKHYGFVIRHRLVPRTFSEINGAKVFDTEEVVVGTNTLPFEDYIELRGICFIIATVFSSTELIPLKRLMFEYGIDMAAWVFNINKGLSKYSEVYSYSQAFLQETKDELFLTREALIDFYSDSENYEALLDGRLGDNLLRKYKCLVLSKAYLPLLDLAISEACKLMYGKIDDDKIRPMLDDIYLYLSTRNMKPIFEKLDNMDESLIRLKYDIPKWLQNTDESLRLENFHKPYTYMVNLTRETKVEMKNLVMMNKDIELSTQILYRDGTIRDFWPVWIDREKAEIE